MSFPVFRRWLQFIDFLVSFSCIITIDALALHFPRYFPTLSCSNIGARNKNFLCYQKLSLEQILRYVKQAAGSVMSSVWNNYDLPWKNGNPFIGLRNNGAICM